MPSGPELRSIKGSIPNSVDIPRDSSCTNVRSALIICIRYLREKVASGDRQLPARIRRPLDRINKAMQVNRHIEGRQAGLPGPDRLGEQSIHLPDVERIAAGEVGRDIYETLGYGQIIQLVASLCALHA